MSTWQPARRPRSYKPRSLLIRLLKVSALLFLSYTFFETLYTRSKLSRAASIEPPKLGKEKIFIASLHWNNEKILREAWIPALLNLVSEIGRENVFVSIQESGSWDDSKGALRELDGKLGEAGIARRIVLDNTTHEDEIAREPGLEGWVRTPKGKMELRRIPYLARLRNLVMEPMYELERKEGKRFDRILWLNDVAFDNLDVRNLVATKGGDYAAACSLDFKKTWEFYDTFALRDAEGQNKVMKRWPYFRSQTSRMAVKKGEPARVKSCWNGIVVFDAEPFYSSSKERGLTFRGIPDSLAEYHLEGSECCLIHADNPYGWKGVWLNPNVRVGYSKETYDVVRASGASSGPSFLSIAYGIWTNRLLRWITSPKSADKVVNKGVAGWESDSLKNMEPGKFCLVDEMQVLIWNGWAHV